MVIGALSRNAKRPGEGESIERAISPICFRDSILIQISMRD